MRNAPREIKLKIANHRTMTVAPPSGTRLCVTVDQAAELLNISRSTLDDAIRQGKIPVLRFGSRGGKPVVPYQGLLDVIDAATTKAVATQDQGGSYAEWTARKAS